MSTRTTQVVKAEIHTGDGAAETRTTQVVKTAVVDYGSYLMGGSLRTTQVVKVIIADRFGPAGGGLMLQGIGT